MPCPRRRRRGGGGAVMAAVLVAGVVVHAATSPSDATPWGPARPVLKSPPTLIYPRVTGDAMAARHAAAVQAAGGSPDGQGVAPALRDIVAAGSESTPAVAALPHGAWTDLPPSAGGGRLWRLGIASDGASSPSISLVLSHVSLPRSARLVVFAPGSAAGGPAPGACSGLDARPDAYDPRTTACVGPLSDEGVAARGRAVAVPGLPGPAAVVEVWVPRRASTPPSLTIDLVAPALDGDAVSAACGRMEGPAFHARRLLEKGGGGDAALPALGFEGGGPAPDDVTLPPDDAGGLLPAPVAGGDDAARATTPGNHAGLASADKNKPHAHERSAAASAASAAANSTAAAPTADAPTLHASYDFTPFLQRYDMYTSQCTPSATCYTVPGGGPSPWGNGTEPNIDLANATRATVAIYAVDRNLKTFSLCSGVMLRLGGGAASGGAGRRAPLLLTADHCLGNRTSVDNFDLWTLLFNFNAPCAPVPGQPGYNIFAPPVDSTLSLTNPANSLVQGARLLFFDAASDVTLLDIPGGVPSSYHTFRVGYDPAAMGSPDADRADAHLPPLPAHAVALHHPNGTPLRASFTGADHMRTSFRPPVGRWPPGQRVPSNVTHIRTTYVLGTTERGSSGAPLIDLSSGAVFAVLTGGFSTCANASAADYYGRLSSAWGAGLGNFLGVIGDEATAAAAGALVSNYSVGLNAAVNGMGATNGTFASGGGAAAAAKAALSPGSLTGEEGGSPGPALGFSPSTLMWNASARHSSENIDVFLVAPPRPGDTIIVSAYVWPLAWADGAADPRDAIGVVPPRFNLSSPAQSVEVALVPSGGSPAASGLVSLSPPKGALPGDASGLARFYLWLEGRSALDDSWHDEVGVKVVVSADPGATYATWLPKNESEGTVTPPLLVQAPDVRSPSGRAVFRYVPEAGEPGLWDIQVCLRPGLLGDSAVAIYRDGALAALTSDAPPYNGQRPGCVDIYSLPTVLGSAYELVVSDSDFLNTVLPVDAVTLMSWLPVDRAWEADEWATPVDPAARTAALAANLPSDWGRGGIFGGAGDLPPGGLAVNEFPAVARLDGPDNVTLAVFLAGAEDGASSPLAAPGSAAVVTASLRPVPGSGAWPSAGNISDLVVTPPTLHWVAGNATAPAAVTVGWADGRGPRPGDPGRKPLPIRFDLVLNLTSPPSVVGAPASTDVVRGYAGPARAGGPPAPPQDAWTPPFTLSAPALNLSTGAAAVGVRLPSRTYVDLTACLADSAAYPTVALALFTEAGQLLRTYAGGTAIASTPDGCIFVEAEDLAEGVTTAAVVDSSLAAALLPAEALTRFIATPASARRGRRPPRGSAAARGAGSDVPE